MNIIFLKINFICIQFIQWRLDENIPIQYRQYMNIVNKIHQWISGISFD